MLQLEFTWWILPILVAGILLIFSQYQNAQYTGIWRIRWAVVFQALAFAAILFQLLKPLWRQTTTTFHPPCISVWTDESRSFLGGQVLFRERVSHKLIQSIRSYYEPKGYRVEVFCFSDSVMAGAVGDGADSKFGLGIMTRLEKVFKQLSDTSLLKNHQAAFLFSDGRNTLAPSQISTSAHVPLFPVVIRHGRYADAALDSVHYIPDSDSSLRVFWSLYSDSLSFPDLSLHHFGKQVFHAGLTGSCRAHGAEFKCRARFNWLAPDSLSPTSVKGWLRLTGDKNPKNDTAFLVKKHNRDKKKILFVGPNNSPDARWLASLLKDISSLQFTYVNIMNVKDVRFNPGSQLWVSYSNFKRFRHRIMKIIPDRDGSLVVFADGAPKTPFSKKASLRSTEAGESFFPLFHKTLDELGQNVERPTNFSEHDCVIALSGDAHQACLISKIRHQKQNLIWFGLVRFWPNLFDPAVNLMNKEQIRDLILGTAKLAESQAAPLNVSILKEKPEQAGFTLHIQKGDGSANVPPELSVSVRGMGENFRYPISGWPPSQRDTFVHIPEISPGNYRLSLYSDSLLLWRSPVVVQSALSAEMKATYWNMAWLSDVASKSGGKILDTGPDTNRMILDFPLLSDGHLKQAETKYYPLYSLPWTFGLVVLCLGASWVFRKWAQVD